MRWARLPPDRAFTQDTISRRLIVTVALAAGITLLLLAVFVEFGGQWSKPDIEATGMVREVGAVLRMVRVAPAMDRETLLAAAQSRQIHFGWYPEASPLAKALAAGHYRRSEIEESWHFLSPFLGQRPPAIAVFQEDNPVSTLPGLPYDRSLYHDAYFVGIQLDDGSWVLCVALQRFWGLYAFQRLMLEGMMLFVWIIAVSLIASRQLSRPIEYLAHEVRRLDAQPNYARVSEAGPREIRQVAVTINVMQARIAKFILDRTTMLAAISHDLRTPLTRIRLRGEFIDCPTQQKLLFRDVDEMQAMIDGALSFFRDDASHETQTAFDLSGLLETVAYDFCDQGHDVRYDNPGRVGYRGPVNAIKRVFTNLVENAIKYATPPQIILAPADMTDAPSAGIRATGWVVTILDHGPGIPPNALDAVFEPYFRLDKSRNRQTGGVGLGLTSARTVMRGLGGDIIIENRAEGGLRVRVLLPASD